MSLSLYFPFFFFVVQMLGQVVGPRVVYQSSIVASNHPIGSQASIGSYVVRMDGLCMLYLVFKTILILV